VLVVWTGVCEEKEKPRHFILSKKGEKKNETLNSPAAPSSRRHTTPALGRASTQPQTPATTAATADRAAGAWVTVSTSFFPFFASAPSFSCSVCEAPHLVLQTRVTLSQASRASGATGDDANRCRKCRRPPLRSKPLILLLARATLSLEHREPRCRAPSRD